MLRRTHLAIALAVALHFMSHVSHEYIFLVIVLVATVIPDIDSGFSALGKHWFSKPVQAITSHRGFIHSYTFCIALSIIIALIYPIAALPFFLGYSFHLLADSFTVQGIKPFWPFKGVSKGPVVVGGAVEDAIFWSFVILIVIFFITLFI